MTISHIKIPQSSVALKFWTEPNVYEINVIKDEIP